MTTDNFGDNLDEFEPFDPDLMPTFDLPNLLNDLLAHVVALESLLAGYGIFPPELLDYAVVRSRQNMDQRFAELRDANKSPKYTTAQLRAMLKQATKKDWLSE